MCDFHNAKLMLCFVSTKLFPNFFSGNFVEIWLKPY